jgi:nucleotide-binding universal stress UspA family protein
MSDTRPILLATDGSPSAAEAQQEAFELAQRLAAPLLVVSVLHPGLPAVGYAGYGYVDVVAELTEAEHLRTQKLLAEIEETARAVDLVLHDRSRRPSSTRSAGSQRSATHADRRGLDG